MLLVVVEMGQAFMFGLGMGDMGGVSVKNHCIVRLNRYILYKIYGGDQAYECGL